MDYFNAISQKGGKKKGHSCLKKLYVRSNQGRPKAAEWLSSSWRAAVSILYLFIYLFFLCQPRCDRAAEQNIFFNPSQGKFPSNFAQLHLLFCVREGLQILACRLLPSSASQLAEQPSRKRAQRACFSQIVCCFFRHLCLNICKVA